MEESKNVAGCANAPTGSFNSQPELTLESLSQAYDDYQSKGQPTATSATGAGVAPGFGGGNIRNLVTSLTGSGFSLPFIFSKIYVLFDLLQKYGPAIMEAIEEFKRLFGNQQQQ